MYQRAINLPKIPTRSFFLWGPRQSGKSTLLKKKYPKAHWIDLLETNTQVKYLKKPWLLREELLKKPECKLVIIDEIQKVPLLLDEVHWLIENKKIVFGLCGSSARKLKRGHANLLGGRATRYQMHGLVSTELENNWNITSLLNKGYLPEVYLSDQPKILLDGYINDYLKEEIADEGLTRNLMAFANFLDMAALGDTEIISYSNIARESAISVPSVKEYFQILEDTLLGNYLYAYRKRPKRRLIHAPKFYFEDIGTVNLLTKRGKLEQGGELFGKALENWVFHEINAYNHYRQKLADITYWRTHGGVEVDFIINDMECAIEVKSSNGISSHHLKGLREIVKDGNVKRRIVVCMEDKARVKEDGIEILPVKEFTKALWGGELF